MSSRFRLIAVEFARSPIRSLVRKPFDMGIAGDKPRQLAPTVGTTGSGSTDSPAPSSTTSKIDIDTIVGIAASTDIDTASKIDIDAIVGIAVPTDVDTTSEIDIDPVAGITVPAIVIDNPVEPEVDAVNSTVVSNASPSTSTSLRRRTPSTLPQA